MDGQTHLKSVYSHFNTQKTVDSPVQSGTDTIQNITFYSKDVFATGALVSGTFNAARNRFLCIFCN